MKPLAHIIPVLFAATACAAATNRVVDLQSAYLLALDRSERVGIAAAEWRAADARYGQARDSLLPDVSLSASHKFVNTGAGGDASEISVNAGQVIFSGFRITRLAQAREAEGRAAKLNEKRTRELLFLDVADAYYQAVLCRRDLDVIREYTNTLARAVAETARRVELGRSRKADLLKAGANLAEAVADSAAASARSDAAMETLSFLVGLPAESISPAGLPPLAGNPGLADKLARLSRRSDILAAAELEKAAGHQARAADGDRLPAVRVDAGATLHENPDGEENWNIKLSMELPVFDDSVRRAKAREEKAQLAISGLNLAALRRTAESDVRGAYVSFMGSMAQLAALREAAEAARANSDEQQKDYELGRASRLEALSALAQWMQLRRGENAADIAARAALVRLHVAAGEVEQ